MLHTIFSSATRAGESNSKSFQIIRDLNSTVCVCVFLLCLKVNTPFCTQGFWDGGAGRDTDKKTKGAGEAAVRDQHAPGI